MVAGRYELERPLGHGAMAVVDLARDVELEIDLETRVGDDDVGEVAPSAARGRAGYRRCRPCRGRRRLRSPGLARLPSCGW